jgi:hypothetical protein
MIQNNNTGCNTEIKEHCPWYCPEMTKIFNTINQQKDSYKYGNKQQESFQELIFVIFPDEFIKLADQYLVIFCHLCDSVHVKTKRRETGFYFICKGTHSDSESCVNRSEINLIFADILIYYLRMKLKPCQ